MKRTILAFAIMVFTVGANLTVSAQVQNTKQTSAHQDNSTDLQKFRKEVNERIKENETKIAELRTKLAAKQQDVKEKYNKRIDALEQKNKELKSKVANYKEDENNVSWQSFKKELNHDMDELAKALKSITIDNVD